MDNKKLNNIILNCMNQYNKTDDHKERRVEMYKYFIERYCNN